MSYAPPVTTSERECAKCGSTTDVGVYTVSAAGGDTAVILLCPVCGKPVRDLVDYGQTKPGEVPIKRGGVPMTHRVIPVD